MITTLLFLISDLGMGFGVGTSVGIRCFSLSEKISLDGQVGPINMEVGGMFYSGGDRAIDPYRIYNGSGMFFTGRWVGRRPKFLFLGCSAAMLISSSGEDGPGSHSMFLASVDGGVGLRYTFKHLGEPAADLYFLADIKIGNISHGGYSLSSIGVGVYLLPFKWGSESAEQKQQEDQP